MKKITLLFIFFTLTAFGDQSPHMTDKPPTIRVLIKQDAKGSLIETKGSYKVYNPQNGKLLSTGLLGKRFFALPQKDGLKWGEGFPGVFQLQIVSSTADSSILVDGIEYRGLMEIYSFDEKIQIINEIDIESYISSILTEQFSGMHYSFPVLEALSIVYRTNATHTALKNHGCYYHVKASDVSYGGLASTLIDFDIEKAIHQTKYLVMTYKEMPFPCGVTEDCAGSTSSYSTLFRKTTLSPGGVDVPLAMQHRPSSKWSLSLSLQELAHRLDIKSVDHVDLFIDKPSCKVYGARIKERGGSYVDFTIIDLFEKLAPQLKSSDFTISMTTDSITFEGYGSGMGTGLCLYASQEKGRKGATMQEILSDFFPFTYLQKIEKFGNQPSTIR